MSTWLRNVRSEFLELAAFNAQSARHCISIGLEKQAAYYAKRAYRCGLLARPDLDLPLMEAADD